MPKCPLETSDGPILLSIWNEVILKNCADPEKLKLADISPVYKKENPLLAKNYRPVSILPTTTKLFERQWHIQRLSVGELMQNNINHLTISSTKMRLHVLRHLI